MRSPAEADLAYFLPVNSADILHCATFEECEDDLLEAAGIPRTVTTTADGGTVSRLINGKPCEVPVMVLSPHARKTFDILTSFASGNVISDALHIGTLDAFVMTQGDVWKRVPRSYWALHNPFQQPRARFRIERLDNNVPATAIGRTIFLCKMRFAKWVESAGLRELRNELTRPAYSQEYKAEVSTDKLVPITRFTCRAESEAWYMSRVEDAIRLGMQYSRLQDEADGRKVGIGRERMRELRRKLAPDHWQSRGRPPN